MNKNNEFNKKNIIYKAIKRLKPEAIFYVDGDVIVWKDKSIEQPSNKEIDDEILLIEVEYNNTEYQRLRATEYNKLNQDELRFDDLENGTTTWQDSINAIKEQYPKPE